MSHSSVLFTLIFYLLHPLYNLPFHSPLFRVIACQDFCSTYGFRDRDTLLYVEALYL